MISDIVIPLIAVGLAELGDKTQLSILLISSKTEKHLQLFIGAMLAFLITDGLAILFGAMITVFIPVDIIKILGGAVFIFLGILILLESNSEGEGRLNYRNPFLSGFLLVFVTEWGDKTQIVSAVFATQYNVLMVLTGVMLALCILSIMAIYLGKFVSDRIDKKMISMVSGIVFLLIGISFILV